jgi:hypothetical protein
MSLWQCQQVTCTNCHRLLSAARTQFERHRWHSISSSGTPSTAAAASTIATMVISRCPQAGHFSGLRGGEMTCDIGWLHPFQARQASHPAWVIGGIKVAHPLHALAGESLYAALPICFYDEVGVPQVKPPFA